MNYEANIQSSVSIEKETFISSFSGPLRLYLKTIRLQSNDFL